MKINLAKVIPFFLTGILFFSCGDGDSDSKNVIDTDVLDSKSSLNTEFDGKIFSIPSPIQMALLLKEINAPFNQDLINDTKNLNNYNNEFKQALNLGVYGTDLGYASVSNQNSASLNCLSAVESLTNKLGLNGIFDKSFLTRFEKNKTIDDSVLVIVSEAFRNGDSFLKSAKRKQTSALILTGGWIESLFFVCEINKSFKNQKIIERIGGQQQTLSTIIEILTEYNEKGINDELLLHFKDLKTSFDKITVDYTYIKPKTDDKNKTTTLQHITTVKVDSELLKEIAKKVISIRETIIN